MRKLILLFVIAIIVGLHSCKPSFRPENISRADSTMIPASDSNSWALLPFVKVDSVNPILQPGNNSFVDPITHKQTGWEAKNVFNPAIAVRNDTVFMLYRAQDSIGKPTGTSRVGLAEALMVFILHVTQHRIVSAKRCV